MYTTSSSPQKLYELSTDKKAKLGSRLDDEHGNVYRYALCGAADILSATVCQSNITYTSANLQQRTLAVASQTDGGMVRGARRVAFTLGVNLVANELAEGVFYYLTGAGNGVIVPILGHPAQVSGTAGYFLIEQALPQSISGGTFRASVYPNQFSGVIATAAPPSKPVLGITPFDIPANSYFWLQTAGLAVVRVDSGQTPVEGRAVIPSITTAGAVDAVPTSSQAADNHNTASYDNTVDPIGRCMAVTISGTRNCLIYLWRP